MSAKQATGKSWRAEIIVAVIGFLGITTAAVISKWDVLFPAQDRRLENRGPQLSPDRKVQDQPNPGLPYPQSAGTPPQILTFTASQSMVQEGQKITLSWVVQGAQRLRLLPGDQAVPGPEGSFDVTPDYDVTYVLNATGQNGQTTEKRLDVRVIGPPIDPNRRKAEVVRVATEAARAMATLDLEKFAAMLHEPFSIAGRDLSGEILRQELQLIFDRLRARLGAQKYKVIATEVLTVAEYRSQLTRNPKIVIPKLDAKLAALNLTSEDYVVMIGGRDPTGAPTSSTPTFVGYRGGRCKLLALE